MKRTLKRVELLFVKSEFVADGVSLRTPDGKYGSSAAAKDAGFRAGDEVTVVLTRDLKHLQDLAFRYESVSK